MGLFDAFSSSTGQKASGLAFGHEKEGFEEGFGQAKKYSNKGMQQATGSINQALTPYQQLQGGYDKGASAYGDAFGLGGAEGYDRARESFQTGPGYQFQQEQGLDALNRTANSRGLLASGNNTQDILKFSQGLADQEWDDYTAGLQPYLGLQQGNAGAQAGLYSQLANMQNNQGQYLGNVGYQSKTGVGQAGGQMEMNKYQADQTANSNTWSAILGLANTAAKAYGAA